MPQPKISRHLAYLRKAGLATARRSGLWCYYSLAPAQTAFHKRLLSCLGNCFAEVMNILQREVVPLLQQQFALEVVAIYEALAGAWQTGRGPGPVNEKQPVAQP